MDRGEDGQGVLSTLFSIRMTSIVGDRMLVVDELMDV